MKVFQQTQSTCDPEQSPRVYAENWFHAYAEDWLEEPADDLLEISASGYGDMVLVDPDVTWDQIVEECGGEYVLVAVGADVLLWTEPSPNDEQVLTLDGDTASAALTWVAALVLVAGIRA